MTNQILRKAAAAAAVVPALFGVSRSAQAVIVCETHQECATEVYPCVSYPDGTVGFCSQQVCHDVTNCWDDGTVYC